MKKLGKNVEAKTFYTWKEHKYILNLDDDEVDVLIKWLTQIYQQSLAPMNVVLFKWRNFYKRRN